MTGYEAVGYPDLVQPPRPVCRCQAGIHVCIDLPVEYGDPAPQLTERLTVIRVWIDGWQQNRGIDHEV